MHVLYRITYLPHLETELPKYYIGSKYNYKPGYMGSLSSKSKEAFTNGLTLAEWWKRETKINSNDFKFEILETFEDLTPNELVILEHDLQVKLNVLGENYFNRGLATVGFVSSKNTEETKRIKSARTKKYWDSLSPSQKEARIKARSLEAVSKSLKERWKNPTKKMQNRKVHGRPKGAKDLESRKQREERMVSIEGVVYSSAKEAATVYGVHPVNIRRKCRTSKYIDWFYI